ncbi:translocation/assembly module TamB domain-containing protein [Rhodohalobacter sp.]|uniref:translocation/assembly module TamB domain-containing protein n=1 Tax=Rhodohalobacter sp. TaxID=1974210 RepID=UPI002ACDAFEB|nr:translocation/assembly module TamB domain-containing protein [Rhodohalobacter sp.]MDZ7755013.1 translocation/assembly module TamB domain-containing protein [Rhodohalobacter sp.]
MTQEPETHTETKNNRRWVKWAVFAAILIGLIVSLRLFLKSDMLFNYARNLAEKQVGEILNGSLEIESIRGDLLNGFTVYGARVADNQNETIATLDSAYVRYRFFDVIRSPYTVEQLSIHGMQSFIKQDADSVWNVTALFPEATAEDEQAGSVYWAIGDLEISDLNADIESDYLLPDGFVNVRNLNLSASGGMEKSGYSANIRSLEFQLEEARLPEQVDFMMEARGDDERITLESLAVQTGRTMLRAESQYDINEALTASAGFTPLSRDDIAAYVENLPLQHDLNIEIGAEGQLSNLSLSANISGTGMEMLSIEAILNAEGSPSLSRIDVNIQNLDTPELTGIELSPSVAEFQFSGEGFIPLENFQESDWSGSMNFADLSYDQYQIDRFESDYELDDDRANFTAKAIKAGEQIDLEFAAEQIWSEVPVWNGRIETGSINLATWLAEPGLESEMNIRTTFSGSGISPDQIQANTEIAVEGGSFGEQPFSEILFRGNLNTQTLAGNLSARLDQSRLEARMDAESWQQEPSYNFNVSILEFNLAEIAGFEDFPTLLNGTFEGSGSGISLDTIQMQAAVAMDSSFVNKAPIETLKSDIRIENQFLTLENTLLESPIVDAEISARHHLTDLANLENRVDFRATLKDLQPLAPLANAEVLKSEGELSGVLNRSGEGYLAFNGEASLQNIQLDSLFLSDELNGNIQARLMDDPEADIELQLRKSTVSGFTVQDVRFQSSVKQGESATSGDFTFEIFNEDVCTLHHEGNFRVEDTAALVQTTMLDFSTELRKLTLDRPFDFEYDMENQTARLDTATIRDSSEEAFLSIWAKEISSEVQDAGLVAERLNLGAIQTLMMEDPVAEGYLSGELNFENEDDSLYVSVNGDVRDIVYEDGSMDRFNFYLNIEEEWLQFAFGGIENENRLFEGLLQVPYVPGNPATFDDQFFDREVAGYFELFDTDLSYWFTFLPDFESEETSGSINMRADLSGTAGNPELIGNLQLQQAKFSGIEIDSAELDLNYVHDDEYVEFEGQVIARGEPVLDMDARFPFIVDLRSAEVLLPEQDDEVSLNFKTDEFNLAIFNDFLDNEMFRELRGRLNGDLSLSGRLDDLQTSGNLELLSGNLRVVPAGITLSDISSKVNFSGESVELERFRMKSGPGQIEASGSLEMEDLTPGNLQMTIRGRQFQAANTSEYKAIIDLDANLTGTVEEPRLTGKLTFLNGFVNLQNFGEESVEDVQLEDEEESEPVEFYEMLEMEMNVGIERQFFIRNRQFLDMEIELIGDVDLVKRRNEDLQMFGSLEGVRGYARPLGKNFMLDEALVTFYGPVDDPELNIRTEFEPAQAQSEVQIFYIIEGTAQEPKFRFDSEPPLELQDIISYTLFGKPFYELQSWEQVVAGSGSSPSAANLALDVLLDRVEMLASQSLGIDVVQIDNSRTGSDSSTSIKTGWYLNRRTFFAVINEISSSRPKTLFMLEYMLTEHLELLITQGDDSREGIDLRWKYEY